MLPSRRKPPRGSNRPALIWPRHRRFVRSHGCCVPGCGKGPIEFCHVRSAANSGTGIKPHDCFGMSLCREHHAEQHRVGQVEFQKRHRIDMMALSREFTKRSPDKAMRDSLKLREAADAHRP